jgi:class 3 adenylate cyclase/tetratricopeptide (TPR) repeat protein
MSPIARAGERKQVSVLFCDIVGSTALVGRLGAEEFHDLISDFFELATAVVHRLEGTINQFLGDGFMALFGAPLAREEHTRRAVLAALDLHSRVARALGSRGVQIRIGISTGVVVVGQIGDALRMDYTAFGDTTVLAARLEAAAAPGDILLSDEAAQRVRGYFDLGPPLVATVKGLTLVTRRVLGLGERKSRLDDERLFTPFVGRDAELGSLFDALAQARHGAGRVVGIVGEPGLGKSRLLIEFRRLLTDVAVREGRCVSYGTAIPYLPVIDLLRESCAIGATDGYQAIVARLEDVLSELSIDPATALPFLLHLLGQSEGVQAATELDPATIKGRTFDILRELWRAQCRRRPLVLILEDLHWMDKTSEAFVATLVEALPTMPLLLLTSYRSGYAPPWEASGAFAKLQLQPLSDQASRAVVAAMLARPRDQATSGDLTDCIVARGEGNPFFLEELAQATQQHRAGVGTALPQTVQEVLAARIDSLSDDAKDLVQTASVLGREFSLALLGALHGCNEQVVASLGELEKLELVFRQDGGSSGTSLAFKHALTQEVAYGSLLGKRRRDLHGEAGHALEALHAGNLVEHCELIAYHYVRSGEAEKAAEYLILANRKAAQRNAMEEAIEYFYQALRVLETLADSEHNRQRRLRLVFDQTGEFHFLHRHQEYHELILRHAALAESAGQPELLGAFYARLGHRQWTSNQLRQCVPTLVRGAELCDESGNLIDAAGAYAILAWAHLRLGEYELVGTCRDRALHRLQQTFDPVWYSFARAAMVLRYAHCGRWGEAIDEAREAIDEGRARGDRAIVAFNTGWMAYAYMEQGDWARARENAELALREAPTVYFHGFPQMFLARVMCETHENVRGLDSLREVEQLIDKAGHRPAWGLAACALGAACIALGDRTGAKAVLLRVCEASDRDGDCFFTARSSRLLGEVALAEGDLAQARQRFDRTAALSQPTGMLGELGFALAGRARVERATGEFLSARRHMAAALGVLTRLCTLHEPERLRAELRELPG